MEGEEQQPGGQGARASNSTTCDKATSLQHAEPMSDHPFPAILEKLLLHIQVKELMTGWSCVVCSFWSWAGWAVKGNGLVSVPAEQCSQCDTL
jgi:hypothetical protein